MYTQTSLMSETPNPSPDTVMSAPVQQRRGGGRTKIVKQNSFCVAQQEFRSQPKTKPAFKKPPPKRIVRSMHLSRRSSMDFVKPLTEPAALPSKSRGKKVLVRELVLTSCQPDDHKLVKDVVKRLPGRAKIEQRVSSTTTHLICGESRRTLNMLKAILHGCWIVSLNWLYECLEKNTWVDEEVYEMVSFSAAVKQRRIERELLPESDLLKDHGPFYIGRHCHVPKKELMELIQVAGGKCVNQLKMAKVILSHDYDASNRATTVQVTEKWVLDSVQQHCTLPFDSYLLQN